MSPALHVETTILPGNRIEITSPELPPGRSATVFVIIDMETSLKRPLFEVLEGYQGGLFKTGAEVDEYLREMRG